MRKVASLAILCWLSVSLTAQLANPASADSDNRSWTRQFQSRQAQAFSVSPAGGDAALTIPIPLPRGAGGFTPALSLDYSSADLSNGPVGVGWRLGFPTIERRLVPGLGVITEYVVGTSRSRLIEIGQHSSGILFAFRQGTTGPFFFHYTQSDSWALSGSDGAEWIFGRHAALRRATRTAARAWYFEEASDIFGHRIVASYEKRADELLLAAISYVERDPSSVVSRDADGTVADICTVFHYCVELMWAARPDPLIGAHDTEVFWLRDRLEQIDLKAAGTLRMSWLLAYAPATPNSIGRTERSLLQEIVRRGHGTSGPEDEVALRIETSAAGGSRWTQVTWPGMPPPFPNGLSTAADFDGDGRVDVMGVLPWGDHADTWVLTRSEGNDWYEVRVNGTVDPARALKVAWPRGPFRLFPWPIWSFFEEGEPCRSSREAWELPPAGASYVGDYDANGFPDIAYALPTAATPPKTTVRWQMFLSHGDGWIGSSREHPELKRWESGPLSDLPDVDCKMPRRFSLGVYCRGGRFDPDDRDDIACFVPERAVWQIGHAGNDDWNVEEVDATSYAPAVKDAPAWGEDCLAGDLDGNGIDEVACPSMSHTALEVLRRSDDGSWKHETWPVEMSAGETLTACLSASLNEDARTDIVCSTSTPGKWLLAVSDGRKFRAGTISRGFSTTDLHEQCFTADIDNDGRTDLVCLEKAPNRFVINYARGLTLSASEVFEPPVPASINPEPGWCRFGDFTGDTALEAVCVASDFGTSIVTRPNVPVPDEMKAYTDAMGAITRLTFAPAADEKLSAPVIRRRLLKSVEVDPGAGQSILRKTFSYAGKPLGRFGAWVMTFSSMTENVFDIAGASVTLLSSTTIDHEAFGDPEDPLPIVTATQRLEANGCTLERRELAYDRSVHAVKGAPRLISTRDWAAPTPSGGVCSALVEVRSAQIEYDNQDRVACRISRFGTAGALRFDCDAYETGDVIPLMASDRPPRVARSGVFTSCETEDDRISGACRARAKYEELTHSASAPGTVRAWSRRRFDFARSVAPCEQLDSSPTWTSAPLTIQQVDETGGERRFRHASYDRHGNVVCSGLTSGTFKRIEWHPLGHTPARLCDFTGKVCSNLEYSGNGTPSDQPTIPGVLTRLTKPWGSMTSFSFDALGRLTGSSDSDRGATRLTRSDFGDPARQTLTEVSPSGEQVEIRIDGFGRARLTTHRPVLGQPYAIETHYDALSRAIGSSTPHFLGNIPKWKYIVYDALGREASISNPDGSSETFAYAPHEATVTDALGTAIRYRSQFSGGGEQWDVERTAPSARLVGRYKRDVLGRTITASDASGVLARWKFDSFGNLAEVSETGIGSTQLTYDELGRRKSAQNAKGLTTEWIHDTAGRPARSVTGRWWNRSSHTFQYDDSPTGLGRLRRVANEWMEYSWKYDEAARTRLVQFKERSEPGARTAKLSYQYDAESRLRAITLPDRRTIEWRHAGDRVQSVVDVRTGQPIVTYGYDEYGLPAEETFADGTRVTRRRDQSGRLASVLLSWPGASRQFDFSYTLTGNLYQVTRDGAAALQAVVDEEGRITEIRTPSAGRQFTYDALANIETITPGARLEYGARHPHALMKIDGEGVSNDSVMRATRFGGATLQYTHDAPSGVSYGWRFWRNESVFRDALGLPYLTRSWRGDGKRAFGLWHVRGNDCHVAIPSPFGTAAISRCGSSSYESVHGGPGPLLLGTGRRSKSGTVLSEPALHPYEPLTRPELEAFLQPTTVTLANGLLQVQGWRFHAPSIGRFLQPDPVYPPRSSPFELNRYAFARSNPLRFTDPFGLQSFSWEVSTSWTSGGGGTSGSWPSFQFFTPSISVVPTFGPIRIGSELSTSITTTAQSSAPERLDDLFGWFTYRGESFIEFKTETQWSVGNSFGKGPTISTDASHAMGLSLGPLMGEYSTDGTVAVGVMLGPPSLKAGQFDLSLLEAGPIVTYKPSSGTVGFGVQGRVLGVTGQTTVTPSIGSGLLLLYRDLEAAIMNNVCGMGCGQ